MASAKRCPSCDRSVPNWEWRCPYCEEVLNSCWLRRIPVSIILATAFFFLAFSLCLFSGEEFLVSVSSLFDILLVLARNPRGAFVLSLMGIIAFCPVRYPSPGAPMESIKLVIAMRLLSRLLLFASLAFLTASVVCLISRECGVL